MIGRKSDASEEQEIARPVGFDDFELRLGDIMRGERATMGKSLLDVQRELRIKATYIAAIENCDPDAFDTPGFIAGYVRSYARYLNMDPDVAFATFCDESGFSVAHGMSAQASGSKKGQRDDRAGLQPSADIFLNGRTPFVPTGDAVWSRIEPGAIGSVLVLLGLICAIGYGGYAVLQEVQRVQVAPVEQTPRVLAELDPLEGTVSRSDSENQVLEPDFAGVQPSAEALDRLYRPQALDVPVLVARDGPIANLDPRERGNFASPSFSSPEAPGAFRSADAETRSLLEDLENQPVLSISQVPQVLETLSPSLVVVATAATWVRVRSADGSTIFEATMQPGDTWEAPLTEQPPTMRTGNAGGVYFAMGSKFYGPVGGSGEVYGSLPLSVAGLQETLLPVAADTNATLKRYAEARALPAGGN